jgi:hypothetical protein
MHLATIALFVARVSSLDFYVSPSGSSNSSRLESGSNVFQSIPAAKGAVRAKIASGMSEDITVHVSDGTYYLDSPLNFTTADSGKNGHTVLWKASGPNVTISGGLKLQNWVEDPTKGIWRAAIPQGTKSRNLFVNGWAANYARKKLVRGNFTATNTSYTWNDPKFDWLMQTPGIEKAEIRSIQSFTDRYSPIAGVSNRSLVMVQPVWENNIIGWDHIGSPFADFGLWVQNALALLEEGGQHYVDSDAGLVYYKPLDGENMATVDTHLGILEALVTVSGTYDEPAHDISFEGFHFASHILLSLPPESC